MTVVRLPDHGPDREEDPAVNTDLPRNAIDIQGLIKTYKGTADLPPRRLVFRFRRSETRIGEVIAAIQRVGLMISDLSTTEGKLEDVFLELTRDRLRPTPHDDAS